jgi:hypothetical protein
VRGQTDLDFLKRMFGKLSANFRDAHTNARCADTVGVTSCAESSVVATNSSRLMGDTWVPPMSKKKRLELWTELHCASSSKGTQAKPKNSVVTTADVKASGVTVTIFGRRVLSFGNCPACRMPCYPFDPLVRIAARWVPIALKHT